tara:strand:+ start:1248 stop:1631 length:384 start_codon:yes stop_codon:yes gene_type:complete
MRSKNQKVTADHKKWRSQVAELGCICCGSEAIQIHHCIGASAKHNKIHIGEWFILPLNPFNHSYIDQGRFGLDMLKTEAGQRYGEDDKVKDMPLHEFEKYLFGKVLRMIPDRPFGDDVITAISEWHR